MSYLYASTVAKMESFCSERKVLLGEEGELPVWLGYFDENGTWHNVCFVLGADGSCWTAHGLSEEKILEADTYGNPSVQTMKELPVGWRPKAVDGL